jgi:cytochrome c556
MEATGPREMFVHYQQVGEIHSAVILGDAGATQGPARALANARHTYGADADLAWDLMRAEARVIQGQSDIDDIARSVARMGMACGACHLAMDKGPTMRPGDAPASSRDPAGHMTRHQWAMDRLWEGLVGPSLPAWAAGAGALGDEALELGPGNHPPDAERLAASVHQLGDQARHASDWRQRAEIYGELLQTCAHCHEGFGVRMR